MSNIFENLETEEKKEKNIVICRLNTNSYISSRNKIILKKEITYLKKLSKGYNFLMEDIGNIGAEDVISRIINLNTCKDGVYELIIVNESRDWETGYIDDYDYKLIPYEYPSKDSTN